MKPYFSQGFTNKESSSITFSSASGLWKRRCNNFICSEERTVTLFSMRPIFFIFLYLLVVFLGEHLCAMIFFLSACSYPLRQLLLLVVYSQTGTTWHAIFSLTTAVPPPSESDRSHRREPRQKKNKTKN